MKKVKPYAPFYIKTFRFNSTFFKTYLVVLILSSFLFGSFCLYILHRENSYLKEKAETSYVNMLKTACTGTELTLQNMQQLMQQMIRRKDFTNALIVPTSDSYTRTRSITDQLNHLAVSNPFIKKAYLYVPANKMIYSSDQFYLHVSDMEDHLPFDPNMLLSYTGSRLSSLPDAMFIKKEDGQIYLCQHLYPDNLDSIGMLVFSFEASKLNLFTSHNGTEAAEPLYVYDPQGNTIFPQMSAETVNSRAAALFSYQSPDTNWLYLYPSDTGIPPFRAVIGGIFPFLLIALGLVVLFSLNVAYRANRPFRRLLNKLGHSTPDIGKAKNEIDYLAQIYDDTTAHNQHLQEAILEITPLVLERLFADILSGRIPTEENINATLESLGRPFHPEACFLVVTLELSRKDGEAPDVLETNIHLMQLRELLVHSLPEGYQVYLPAGGGQAVAAILAIPPGEEDEAVRQMVLLIERQSTEMMNPTPYRIETGFGNIYRQLTDIRYSYLEALKNLSRRRFYGEAYNSREENIPVKNRYVERTNQILSYIQSGKLSKALSSADRVIDEIAANPRDGEHIWNDYNQFLQAMIEGTDSLHIGSIEELTRKKERLAASLGEDTDYNKIQTAVRRFCTNVIGSIEQKNKKKAFQHIVRIKEYIHLNYSDSRLSLDTAAEQAGISPSYLSRLFKQEMGTSFVDYVSELRVEKSKKLLETTDLMIKDIAYQTGFNSMQNFFRIFKKWTGIAPGEYRQIKIKI